MNNVNEWLDLWASGKTLRQIAEMYNVSRQTVHNELKGLEDYNPKERIEQRNESIRQYYLDNKMTTKQEIAEMFNVSLSTIEKVCRGLPRYKKHTG